MIERDIIDDIAVNELKCRKTPFVLYRVPGPSAITVFLDCAGVEGDWEQCVPIDPPSGRAPGIGVALERLQFAISILRKATSAKEK